ncbi:MAG: nucleotidyltransferase domain-containing protein [Bernardetiaceae bacterium]|jgi:hypothetical protein|nr:nucleotidyltransferase domain-containing protein [Bernardetiaceae bacterium]
MTLHDLKAQNLLLFEAVSGSRAYGTHHPASDWDLRGVFVLPQAQLYGLHYVEQVADEKNDIIYYELGRFVELLLKNNPNILELLGMPDDCIRLCHPLFRRLRPELFLSKLCRYTFANYAHAQVQKARGLHKKVLNPVAKERKTILEFCYVLQGQGAVPLLAWLVQKGWQPAHCGLVNVPHAREVYALFYDHAAHEGLPGLGFNGLAPSPAATQVSLSSVPAGLAPVAYLSVNHDGYSAYCKDYQQYWEWVEQRNPHRYASTIAHGKNYDAKNMMHVFRLLDMAEEIATEGRITVRRPNREHLLRIRAGEFEYDELLAQAEAQRQRVEKAFDRSPLPPQPDPEAVNHLLVELRQAFYSLHPGGG